MHTNAIGLWLLRATAFSCVLICLSCNEQKKTSPFIQEAEQILQTGDVILRAGNSYASEQIRELSLNDKTYSHVGIVVMEGEEKKICSIEPVDDNSPTDKIRYQTLEEFADPSHNSSFAVYRYQLSADERSHILNFIDRYYSKQIVFDPVFQYETDDKMYCSEMISKAVDSATKGRIRLRRSLITHPSHINSLIRHFKKHKLTKEQILSRPVILMDDVYQHPQCALIKKFEFE